MWLVWCLCLLACDPPPPAMEAPAAPAAAFVYIDGMWAQRALTVQAGLDEALLKRASGDKDGAADWVMQVYRGSFEPELEPLVREQLDPRVAAELEYDFGLVRDAMTDRGDERPKERVAALGARLDAAAVRLDAKQAVLK